MNKGPVLEHYVDVVRKHWILIVVVAVVVLAGGWLYHSRQVPEFEASAKLEIVRRPLRSTAEATYSFEEDQFFYNTQYNLLRTQLDWAGLVLERAAWRILDRVEPAEIGSALTAEQLDALDGPFTEEERKRLGGVPAARRELLGKILEEVVAGRWGITSDSFLAGVRAVPVPNTYLAQLTFRARDPGVAVFLTNLYAELYRDVSMEERRATVQEEIGFLESQLGAVEEKLGAAEGELKAERRTRPPLAQDDLANIPQQEADELAVEVRGLQTELDLRQPEEDHVRAVLAREGVEIVAREAGVSLQLRGMDGGEAALEKVLSENLPILGLEIVDRSENVASVRRRIRELEEGRLRLRARFTEETPEIRRIAGLIENAYRDLGREAAATVVRYLDKGVRLQRTKNALEDRLAGRREAAKALGEYYARLRDRLEAVDRLRGEKDLVVRRFEGLTRLRDEGGDAGGPLMIQNIEVERRARMVDTRQVRPNSAMIFLLTGLAAVFLSLGSAFLIEYLDDTIKTKEDFERFVAVPDIGYIPRISERDFEVKDLAVLEKPRSGVAEAFRSVRTGILFSRRDREIQSFLITSAGPGEGKTTVAVSLAITMAHAARGKVLLVDADLRRARVHAALSVDNAVGLTNCLVGTATLEEAVRETAIENLYVLPSGPTPPNPAELLGGHRMAEILEAARGIYGKIILDTAPLVAVTDACLISPLVDGVFIVISVGKTSYRLIQRGKEALAAVGVEPAGAILNNIRMRQRGYGYGYGYGRYHKGGYGYGAEDEEKAER